MKKYKKHIIIGAVVLILLISIIYYLYASNKNKDIPQEIKQPGTTPVGPPEKIEVGNDSFPLKIGSMGANVKYLQSALKKLGANIIVDGDFGQQTYSAILITVNASSYPVTQEIFTTILKKANNS